MIDRVERVLGDKLAQAFVAADTEQDKIVAILTFGVQFAKEIAQSQVSVAAIIEQSKIGAQHTQELEIGIKLAHHVVGMDKIRKLLDFVSF
jgi:predicted phosphoribosyltransferase